MSQSRTDNLSSDGVRTSRPFRILWLVAPPTLLCLLDVGLTIYGQSDAYWAGEYADVNELSPSFAEYLAIHPLASVAAALVWIAIFWVVIALLPEFLALMASLAIVIGHMDGAGSWLLYRFESYQAWNALHLLTAFVVVLSFKRGQSDDGSAAFDWRRTGLPSWVRWLTVIALMTLPIWWFLIPH